MKILFITDCHFGQDSNFADVAGPDYVNVYGSQLERFLPGLKARVQEGQFDLVVNLGDSIADDSYLNGVSDQSYQVDKDNFTRFLSLWRDCPAPVFHVLGNHDGAMIPRPVFRELLGRDTYFSHELGGFHHIVLDPIWTSVPFCLDDAQLNWLASDLAATELPVIVYLHTPCDETDLSDNYYHHTNPRRYFVAEREKLRAIFEASGKVKLVVHGHSHFYQNNNINGIKYLTLPSFMENDTTGRPSGDYVELDIEPQSIQIRRKRFTPEYSMPTLNQSMVTKIEVAAVS